MASEVLREAANRALATQYGQEFLAAIQAAVSGGVGAPNPIKSVIVTFLDPALPGSWSWDDESGQLTLGIPKGPTGPTGTPPAWQVRQQGGGVLSGIDTLEFATGTTVAAVVGSPNVARVTPPAGGSGSGFTGTADFVRVTTVYGESSWTIATVAVLMVALDGDPQPKYATSPVAVGGYDISGTTLTFKTAAGAVITNLPVGTEIQVIYK